MQQLLLRAGNSVPGLDNIPYELLHAGSAIVAAIAGQAAHITGQIGCIDGVMGLSDVGPLEDLA
eukprot:5585964-Prorocentrum_lima.AAC.1